MFNTDKKKNIYDIEKSKKTIGKKINDLMNEKNVTIYKLCNDLNEHETIITRQTFSKVLNGEAELPLKPLMEICNYFNVSINYLLGETEYKTQEAEICGRYIGYEPQTIEYLHRNKLNDPAQIIDYLINHHTEIAETLFQQIYDMLEIHGMKKLIERNQPDDTKKFAIQIFNDKYGYNSKSVSEKRIEMQDTIKELLDNLNVGEFFLEFAVNPDTVETGLEQVCFVDLIRPYWDEMKKGKKTKKTAQTK